MTVHTNAQGKYCTAVYSVIISDVFLSQTWAESLFPKAHGYSTDVFDLVYVNSRDTRWCQLINNETQTTRRDLVVRIAQKLGWEINDKRINVQVKSAVPGRGVAPSRQSTPREGTKRTLKNAEHGRGINAQ